MLRVGLTGGIGSGKSTVAARLAEHGAVVIDADALAREIVEPGTEGLAEIVAEFGREVLAADGSLDREALAATVFADDAARGRLNAIVHPRVGARTGELVAAAADDAVVVHDVPLLVENHLAPSYQLVIVVDADESVRAARLADARGMSERQARDRMAAQADDAQRRAVADVWLDNSGDRDTVQLAADALWADRLVPYEANVRLGRAVRARALVTDPDPRWPETAARLAARIAAAAGPYPVQHIGSTAVPGLPAKDVIDLQLLVPSLEEADGLAESLAAAGLPRRAGQWWDNPEPLGLAEPPEKRLHGSADPGRPAHLHVRRADGRAAEFALLLRDWLRADDGARDAYARRKHALSGRDDYVDAKEPWFAEAAPQAREWARRTGWTPPSR